MPSTSVSTKKGDGWALVTLDSPGGLNKLGSKTLGPLFEEISENLSGGCRCLGITGRGASFAVGADLNEIARLTPREARTFSDMGNAIFRLLEGADAVVVAGIDGFCLGGGLDLALAADWRMATERSVFGHPGADLGLITGFGGTQRLPRLVGPGRGRKWLYTAERISASDAYHAGLIQEISPEDGFGETLMKRISAFTDRSPDWLRGIKRSFRSYGDGWSESGELRAGS